MEFRSSLGGAVRGRLLRASILGAGMVLATAAVAFADAPYPTSVDVEQDGATVTLTGTWVWEDKSDPCGPGTSANRAVGWAADWGDGWDGNFIKSKGAPKGTGYHMGTAEDNLVRTSDANGGLGDCGQPLLQGASHNSGGGVTGTWGPISYTYGGPGTYEICVVTYDVKYKFEGDAIVPKDAKQLVAGGKDHNYDNSAEGQYLDSGRQCANGEGGVPIIVEVPLPVLELTKKAAEPEFTPIVGSTVLFRFRVANVGQGPAAGPIVINDPMVPDAECPSLVMVGDEDDHLDVGEHIVCVGSYSVTQEDIDAGVITNTATAASGTFVSNEDSVTVTEAATVHVLLDESGSMTSAANRVIRDYNRFLAGQQARRPMAVYGLTLFSSERYVNRYGQRVITSVPNLNSKSFRPAGRTPLYDAATRAINALAATNPQSQVIFVIDTDGDDNASNTATRASLAKLIRQKENDGWKFIFRGSDLSGLQAAVAALR